METLHQTQRIESLIFNNVSASLSASPYMCNATNQTVNLSLYHPFTDAVVYNVSLQVPGGWSYSPTSQLVNATAIGNYSLMFNITSSAATSTSTINASINYSYPSGLSRQRTANSHNRIQLHSSARNCARNPVYYCKQYCI